MATGVLARLRRRWQTTRCLACGERYPRRLPNCPVCKNDPGGFMGVVPPSSPLAK
jgi:hypothetical protein